VRACVCVRVYMRAHLFVPACKGVCACACVPVCARVFNLAHAKRVAARACTNVQTLRARVFALDRGGLRVCPYVCARARACLCVSGRACVPGCR
jgi:hypothetical protein